MIARLPRAAGFARAARAIAGRYRLARRARPASLVYRTPMRPAAGAAVRRTTRVDLAVHVSLALPAASVPLAAARRRSLRAAAHTALRSAPIVPRAMTPPRADTGIVRRCAERRVRVDARPSASPALAAAGAPPVPAPGARARHADTGVVVRHPRLEPPAPVTDTRPEPVREGVRGGGERAAVAAAVDVEHLTARVIDAIDRRIVARRERMGRA
jgi:hypothetical protein